MMSDTVSKFHQLRNNCIKKNLLYEDPEFPIDDMSLLRNEFPAVPIEWKRPGEICENPELFVEGICRFDINQGKLGDCWMLAAMANLTMHRQLYYQVVPQDQGFEPHQYAGIFHYRFWQSGEWVEVIIDDRLPTSEGKLFYLSSSVKNEFWSPLLEKAYAKLHGSYEALIGGYMSEAMEDFTGGVCEIYDVLHENDLYDIVTSSFERGSLVCTAIVAHNTELGDKTKEGLVENHAFSLIATHVMDVETSQFSGKIKMIKVRNPWGNGWEWNGPWSDNSVEWEFISESEKNEMNCKFMKDGEFWMPYIDFIKHFSIVEICNLTPGDGDKKWEVSRESGEWIINKSAGGSPFFKDTFPFNPQYKLTVQNTSSDKTVVISLMQKHFRYANCERYKIRIGFIIYKLKNKKQKLPLTPNYFKVNPDPGRSAICVGGKFKHFVTYRDITTRFKLESGVYCIIPCTYEPNGEKQFLLRVFSQQKHQLECVKA